ncbi:MAG: hypothetical protein IT198_03135, partial [Acidimicrobiia bacterium]|nr:hypothetical protein [Acidimicrobiia bacterium]
MTTKLRRTLTALVALTVFGGILFVVAPASRAVDEIVLSADGSDSGVVDQTRDGQADVASYGSANRGLSVGEQPSAGHDLRYVLPFDLTPEVKSSIARGGAVRLEFTIWRADELRGRSLEVYGLDGAPTGLSDYTRDGLALATFAPTPGRLSLDVTEFAAAASQDTVTIRFQLSSGGDPADGVLTQVNIATQESSKDVNRPKLFAEESPPPPPTPATRIALATDSGVVDLDANGSPDRAGYGAENRALSAGEQGGQGADLHVVMPFEMTDVRAFIAAGGRVTLNYRVWRADNLAGRTLEVYGLSGNLTGLGDYARAGTLLEDYSPTVGRHALDVTGFLSSVTADAVTFRFETSDLANAADGLWTQVNVATAEATLDSNKPQLTFDDSGVGATTTSTTSTTTAPPTTAAPTTTTSTTTTTTTAAPTTTTSTTTTTTTAPPTTTTTTTTTAPPPSGDVQVLDASRAWRFFDGGLNLGTAWREVGYVDLLWEQGVGAFGAGDGGIATAVDLGPSGDRYPTTYFRTTVNVSDV